MIIALAGFLFTGATVTAAPLPEPAVTFELNDTYKSVKAEVFTDAAPAVTINIVAPQPLTIYLQSVCLVDLQHFYKPIMYDYVATDFSVIQSENHCYKLIGNCSTRLLLRLCLIESSFS